MSRAYDNAADARNQQGGRRNLFINGDFQVWQRGTSFSSSGNIYTADRWMSLGSGATMATTQESFTIGQTDVPGEPEYYLQIDTATGNEVYGLNKEETKYVWNEYRGAIKDKINYG